MRCFFFFSTECAANALAPALFAADSQPAIRDFSVAIMSSSHGKQQALLQLMTSHPALLDSLDADLLASITLASSPKDKKKAKATRPQSKQASTGDTSLLTPRESVRLYSAQEAATASRRGPRKPPVIPSPSLSVSSSSSSSSADGGALTAPRPRAMQAAVRTDFEPVPAVAGSYSMADIAGLVHHPSVYETLKHAMRSKKKTRKQIPRPPARNMALAPVQLERETSFSGDEASSAEMDTGDNDTDSEDLGSSSVVREKAAVSPMVLDYRCFVSRTQWIPHSERKSCYVCTRDFNVLRKRHSCRMCGEVICSRCSVFKSVDLPIAENRMRICSCCFFDYRKKKKTLLKNEAEDGSTSTTAAAAVAGRSLTGEQSMAVIEEDQPQSSDDYASQLTSSTLGWLNSSASALTSSSPVPSRCDSDLSSRTASDYSRSSESFSSGDVTLLSCASSSSLSSQRSIEEELEAALKAKQLEREVEASRKRIEDLETQIQSQETHKDQLTRTQQSQLDEARSMIKILQDKLHEQELSAKRAAATRDSICLTKMRQTEIYSNSDDESRALKKKLKILERQLEQAGINVAEVIPYEVAKAKVDEISKRLQEIGSSEIVLEDKQAQAAARKEYYILEQAMEKYNTALMMTDEYIEEEKRKELLWEQTHSEANERAVRLLRSAIPVEIAQLSEKDLKTLETPSGVPFPAELARRLKRTNILQLIRVDPATIAKMHPSVIEGYRANGLSLLERRALHHVLQQPFQQWKKQQKEEMSQKKYVWYLKLKATLTAAVTSYDRHVAMSEGPDNAQVHVCSSLGMACPVKAEDKMEALYAIGLGFPDTEQYLVQEIIKSDPEGAGEKALQEAQAQARELVANERQRQLKAHYKMNIRMVAQAVGALEEMDIAIEALRSLDDSFQYPDDTREATNNSDKTQLETFNTLLQRVRELLLLMAKRAGICLSGKYDPSNDEPDSRSVLEAQLTDEHLDLLQSLLEDIHALCLQETSPWRAKGSTVSLGAYKYVDDLLCVVRAKNASLSANADEAITSVPSSKPANKRVPWKDRPMVFSSVADSEAVSSNGTETVEASSSTADSGNPDEVVIEQLAAPASAMMFSAIRARRKQAMAERSTSSPDPSAVKEPTRPAMPALAKPNDLLAAIRSRQLKSSATAVSDSEATAANTA